jgi:hypothetical protein
MPHQIGSATMIGKPIISGAMPSLFPADDGGWRLAQVRIELGVDKRQSKPGAQWASGERYCGRRKKLGARRSSRRQRSGGQRSQPAAAFGIDCDFAKSDGLARQIRACRNFLHPARRGPKRKRRPEAPL